MYRMIVALFIALSFVGSVNAQSASTAQDTITIIRWHTLYEDATGGVKFSHNGSLKYGMFECTDVVTLDGEYPILDAVYEDADLISFNITAGNITCTIDADHADTTTIYTMRFTLNSADDLESLSSYDTFTYDSNAGYYIMTGTSADVAYVASLYSVSDLYIFRAQYVYIPMVAGN